MKRQVTLDSEQAMCFHAASQATAKGACGAWAPRVRPHTVMCRHPTLGTVSWLQAGTACSPSSQGRTQRPMVPAMWGLGQVSCILASPRTRRTDGINGVGPLPQRSVQDSHGGGGQSASLSLSPDQGMGSRGMGSTLACEGHSPLHLAGLVQPGHGGVCALKVGSPCPSPQYPRPGLERQVQSWAWGVVRMFFVDHLGIQPVSHGAAGAGKVWLHTPIVLQRDL